jgi:hypothetical protein
MTAHLTTLLDTARRIADTDLYPARCRSVITDLTNALQAASTELTESREYALALETELADRAEKQDAFTAMAASMDADAAMTHSVDANNINALTEALAELHAMVVGECPSLLDEDSGGNGELSGQIDDILNGKIPMKTNAREAANILLDHIVYYDLVERRGTEIADAVIAELAKIGVKTDSAATEGKPL